MIELNITPEQLERAKNLYPFTALKSSINNGADNLIGALGEVLVSDYFKAKGYSVEEGSTFDYDMIINGFKVDVKSLRANTTPKDNYYIRIQATQIDQKTEFYFFCYIFNDYSKGFIAGFLKKEEFFKIAKFYEAGSIAPNSKKGFKLKASSYIAYKKDLRKFKQ